jgi:hypothetical protein
MELFLHNSARECSARFAPNSPKPALSRAALAQYLPEQLERIGCQRFRNGNELGDIDLPLMALDHADDRVRSFQESREITL